MCDKVVHSVKLSRVVAFSLDLIFHYDQSCRLLISVSASHALMMIGEHDCRSTLV